MGTNYYIKEDECESCGRYEEIHLGKSSAGWNFSFQYNGGKYYKNIKEMKEWLLSKRIEDEYGESVGYHKFWAMVEEKQKEINNHAEQYPDGSMVIDGYSFSDHVFS